MQVIIFPPVPPFLLDQLPEFSYAANKCNWESLYNSVHFLKKQYPEKQFKEQPYSYIDLVNRTSGLLFIEEITEEIYYVHK